MSNQTIVITGGHTGLGLATTCYLLATTTDSIVWATRSPEAARQQAQKLDNKGRIHVLALDLAAQVSVYAFADTLIGQLQAGTLPPLSTLVCNAGIQFNQGLHQTADGIEQTFGVNHLAHFLLVTLLLPHLGPHGRIVVVSSGTHFDAPRLWVSAATGMPAPRYLGAAALANGEVTAGLDPVSQQANQFRYTTSKLCNLLFTYELDRRLRTQASTITVAAFDPGLMPGTGLARANSPGIQWVWHHVLPLFRLIPGINSPETSGRNLAWLIADPTARAVTGKYYEHQQAIPSSALSRQPELWAELWSGSEQLLAKSAVQGHTTR